MVRHYVKSSININEGQHPRPKEKIKLISETRPMSHKNFKNTILNVDMQGY